MPKTCCYYLIITSYRLKCLTPRCYGNAYKDAVMPIEWELLKKAFIGGIFLSRFEEDNGDSFRCR